MKGLVRLCMCKCRWSCKGLQSTFWFRVYFAFRFDSKVVVASGIFERLVLLD